MGICTRFSLKSVPFPADIEVFERALEDESVTNGVSGDGDLSNGVAKTPSAQLNRPNIACMSDGGVTEAVVLYLVVEFVDGLPTMLSKVGGAAIMIVTALRCARQRNARRNDD